MTDLFAPNLPASAFQTNAFRVEPVIGDSMEPRLRGGRDYVMIKPVHRYCGEGSYLLHQPGLNAYLTKASAILGAETPSVRLFYENGHYRDHVIALDLFNEHVLGIVIADLKVQDERFLRELVENGGN